MGFRPIPKAEREARHQAFLERKANARRTQNSGEICEDSQEDGSDSEPGPPRGVSHRHRLSVDTNDIMKGVEGQLATDEDGRLDHAVGNALPLPEPLPASIVLNDQYF